MKRKGNRLDIIEKFVSNKDVLDIGCVDHEFDNSNSLHNFICSKAKSCIGIDIEREQIQKMVDKGYECYYADAENFNLGKKFDVIVAGELIEHLFNPGNFLNSVKKHMRKDSIFILTTPNPFFFKYILGAIFSNNPGIRDDHTCLFDVYTLSYFLDSHGFKIIDSYWINFSERKYKLAYWLSFLKYLNANFLIVAELT